VSPRRSRGASTSTAARERASCGFALAFALALAFAFAGACRSDPRGPTLDASSALAEGIDAASRLDAAPPLAWPALPRTLEAQRALISSCTLRDVSGAPDGGTEVSLDALARRSLARLDYAIAGEAAIRGWLDAWLARAGARDAYVLVGTHHDSGAQVRAFRALVRRPTRLTDVALEHLVADGRWGGLAEDAQRADGADLRAFLERGDLGALDRLARAHAAHDYTAWKFGYERDVLDIVLAARATGQRVLPCDMSSKVREALVGGGDGASDEVLRLRELHCLRALQDAAPGGPRRIAILWGHDHARPRGFARFLPPDTAVLRVHLFGARVLATPALDRSRGIVLNDAVLVAGTDAPAPTEVALFLPDERTRGDVDRVRRAPEAAAATPEVRASSAAPGTLSLTPVGSDEPRATRTLRLGRDEVAATVGEGAHTYVLRSGGVTVVGGLSLARGERATLAFDGARRMTRLELEVRP